MATLQNKPIHVMAYLNEIPFDLKDDILGFIDEPRHLLSMALTSKEWSNMIIPNHLDYRTLRIPWPGHRYIWAHLALRGYLTKNIRMLRFTERQDVSLKIIPRALRENDAADEPTVFGPDTVMLMTEALCNFKTLKSFTWDGFQGHSLYTEPIFNALGKCADLEELHLIQMLPRIEPFRLDKSILELSNLKKLTLHGKVWANFFEVHRNLESFLNQSPELQELTISYTPISTLFTSCPLLCLTKLHLYSESSPGLNGLSLDGIFLDFIKSHPSIEDLMWAPRDDALEIPQGFLPNIKRLYTKDRIAKTILRDHLLAKTRKMEAISQISLGPNTLELLQTIDGTYLEELHIWRFDDLEQIDELATLFPNLKKLNVHNIGTRTGRYHVDDIVDTLARFSSLEKYLDSSLWLAMHSLPTDMKQETINRLGKACPNLRSLGHWRNSQTVRWEVVLVRNLDTGEVGWSERAVPEDLVA